MLAVRVRAGDGGSMPVLADVLDLVLPADCPGCGTSGAARPLCRACALALTGARPRPTVPEPAPPGLPPCVTVGRYEGVLRELLLAYKERGRIGLAALLGRRLGDAVAAVVPAGSGVRLVPVPATAAAARARHGDHVHRLARHAARRLRHTGRAATVHRALRAVRSVPDSTELSAAGRARRARDAFRPSPVGLARLAAPSGPGRAGPAASAAAARVPTGGGTGPVVLPAGRMVSSGPVDRDAAAGGGVVVPVVLLDDIVTTGATLAATARVLRSAGVPVTAAAVLAATRRRLPVGE